MPQNNHILRSGNEIQARVSMKNLIMIHNVLSHAWSESTTKMYGSGLLLYHILCDQEWLSEEEGAPMSPVIITAFVASLAGCYSGKKLANYFYSVHTGACCALSGQLLR